MLAQKKTNLMKAVKEALLPPIHSHLLKQTHTYTLIRRYKNTRTNTNIPKHPSKIGLMGKVFYFAFLLGLFAKILLLNCEVMKSRSNLICRKDILKRKQHICPKVVKLTNKS